MTIPAQSCAIDASGTHYKQLNQSIRDLAVANRAIEVRNLTGQRYLGTSLGSAQVSLQAYGTPGNDLGAFLNGPEVIVHGDAQDGVGNTMNAGRIVVHGSAGDLTALSMRGGRIFIHGNVGYRCALHMKEFGEEKPALVVGGTCQDFFAEYMAGGIAVLLGLHDGQRPFHTGRFMGTGMHGGVVYVRGEIDPTNLGKEVGLAPLEQADIDQLLPLLKEFCQLFALETSTLMSGPFSKLYPKNRRPYGRLYAY